MKTNTHPTEDVGRFDDLTKQLRARLATIRGPASLARSAHLAPAELEALVVRHGHRGSTAWLERERTLAACRALEHRGARITAAAEAAGFASRAGFERACRRHQRLEPADYRRLGKSSRFALALPRGFHRASVLAYHGRDPDSPCERVRGQRIYKALLTPDGPVVLEIALEARAAGCRAHGRRRLGGESMRHLHATALAMLGLGADVTAFEKRALADERLAAIVARRRGLRVPLSATVFDGLCWAIVGQQINLSFASALRRDVLELAGTRIDDMRAHPTPAEVARLDVADLRQRRFSRAKAEYVTEAARAALDGRLELEALATGSALAAEAALTAVRGIGTWTARYVLMRGCGFADCAPVGDVALAAALQRYAGLPRRPSHDEVEALMRAFAPYRSLATFHLWASLRD